MGWSVGRRVRASRVALGCVGAIVTIMAADGAIAMVATRFILGLRAVAPQALPAAAAYGAIWFRHPSSGLYQVLEPQTTPRRAAPALPAPAGTLNDLD